MSRSHNGRGAPVTTGDSLERMPGELASLASQVRSGELSCRAVVEVQGDRRFWDVDPSQSACLPRLIEFAQRQFAHATGRQPRALVVMINHIQAARTPSGSGGGWHRDSFHDQYKAFAYLTDVQSESQGAFCFLPGSNGALLRLGSALHRVMTGGNRYTDRAIERLLAAGACCQSVLLPAGIPFFLNTSAIHRGLPIREGERIAATVYLGEIERDRYLCGLLEAEPAGRREIRI